MSNPLLQKIKLPGRIFQLPSKGIFYKPETLAEHVKNGEVEVQPLSALAELKLRSPDMLFSGRALREIVLECIPDIKDPDQLVSKDVDAIWCFLKIVTYGPEMKFKSIHDCPGRQVHNQRVNVEELVMNPRNEVLDHASTLYLVTLSNGQRVKLKPVRFNDAIEALHLQQRAEKELSETGHVNQKVMEDAIVNDLLAIIDNVDGVTDRQQIEEWVRSLPKKMFTEIIEASMKCGDWGFNLKVQLKCEDCGEIYEHDLELDPINFFSG